MMTIRIAIISYEFILSPQKLCLSQRFWEQTCTLHLWHSPLEAFQQSTCPFLSPQSYLLSSTKATIADTESNYYNKKSIKLLCIIVTSRSKSPLIRFNNIDSQLALFVVPIHKLVFPIKINTISFETGVSWFLGLFSANCKRARFNAKVEVLGPMINQTTT